jgi:choline dehydrogenase-like flavoprotein
LPVQHPADDADSFIQVGSDGFPRPDQNPAHGEYDYIIVGGGAAGCVLANRLSANPNKRVLVLEAGGDNNALDVKVPAGITRLFKSHLDWNLYTDQQEELDERKVYMARGKLLGGSSSTNATLYHRGTPADYDAWGVPGWSSKDVLTWFTKCENNDYHPKGEYHGKGGTMHVEDPRYHNEMHDVFFSAAKEVGLQYNADFNDWSHQQDGYGQFQVTQEKGVRADMYRQYLQPVLERDNLQVVKGGQTLKVNISGGKATGVTFVTKGPDGRRHQAHVRAGGEVVLSAGAVHSPQILKLSGVGPREELEEHGIDCVQDLPAVGENLQDHPAIVCSNALKEDKSSACLTDQIYKIGSTKIRKRALLAYALFKKGPLTTTGCDHGAFINTLSGPQPDLQVRFVPASALDPDGVGSYVLFGQLAKLGLKYPSGFTFQLLVVRPKSRGSIKLRSSDPFEPPHMDAGFCSDAEGADIQTLRNGLKWARQAAGSSAFGDWFNNEIHPGPEVQSDAQIDEYIRKTLHSGNAIVGTCKMGTDASDSVVNPQLQVHGVQNLRVIDASVIPQIPGGQTGAAAVMVAERGASFVADWAIKGSEQPQVSVRDPVPA